MAWTELKLLSDAGLQMGSSTAALYTAPEDKEVQVCSINLWNSNASTEAVEMFVQGTTDACRFFKEDLGEAIHREFYQNSPITLPAEESIYGNSTTANKVNVRIYGREEQEVPTPPTTNMLGWWTAEEAYTGADASGSQITTDNTAIYSLKDMTGSGHHLNQSNASYQYAYKASILNGYPVIRSATDNSRSMRDTFSVPAAVTVFLVFKPTSWGGELTAIHMHDQGDQNTYLCDTFIQSPNTSPYMNLQSYPVAGPNSGAITLNDWHLVMAVFNGTSSFLSVDDNADITGNCTPPTSPYTWKDFGIGYGDGTGYSKQGDFAEIIVYSSALASDSGDGLAVRQYLNEKYDLGFSI